MTEKTQTVWHCKVGVTGSAVLPKGADAPMRHAVHEAFSKLTALVPEFIFSGWGATLTEPELAVVENRLPREGNVMTQRNDGGPVHPANESHGMNSGMPGMSLRQYAAIKLRVPDSGTDWLDDMIRQSLRTDLAAKAMQSAATNPKGADGFTFEQRAEWAYQQADALLAARERT